MVRSILSQEVVSAIQSAEQLSKTQGFREVTIDGSVTRVKYPFPSPGDWRDCSIYFLMIDRFNNPNKQPNQRWDRKYGYHQGGTFSGVRAQLSYLEDLGVKAIWLSPVLKNSRPDQWKYNYHGYGAQNFISVDERFGTEQELIDLVTEAHAHGLYVILDIVLNHSARVFDYEIDGEVKDRFSDSTVINGQMGVEKSIQWLNGFGYPRPDWRNVIPEGEQLSDDDAVYPDELRNYLFFRRRGTKVTDDPGDSFVKGDFETMRQLVVEYDASVAGQEDIRQQFGSHPVLTILVKSYAYLVAKFDFDGFRIDTVKYVHPDIIQTFGNAMREFALSIGKANFFTFGEIYDDEETIADFVGRNGTTKEGFGIDAALDFPLHYKLPVIVKNIGSEGVEQIRHIFEHRKRLEQELLSSHGEAGRFFVTFLDNHDKKERFNHPLSNDNQITSGLAILCALQGIPCIYYGTEQGLDGTKSSDGSLDLGSLESVREALWGKPDAFSRNSIFYKHIKRITHLRNTQPPLKYGRLYFRQVSGNGTDFGHSAGAGGLISFSRILYDKEILVVANTHTTKEFQGFVIVDPDINRFELEFSVLYSNTDTTGRGRPEIDVYNFWENNQWIGSGRSARLFVKLKPMEVQILGIV
jgi:glycosidase